MAIRYQSNERTRDDVGQFDQEPGLPLTNVGEMFEKVRRARGWSYEEVSKRAGIKSPSTYGTVIFGGRMETNGAFKPIQVTAATISKYALALGLNVRQALKTAGFTQVPKNIIYKLSDVPSKQLWGELRKRDELTETIEAELAAMETSSDTPS